MTKPADQLRSGDLIKCYAFGPGTWVVKAIAASMHRGFTRIQAHPAKYPAAVCELEMRGDVEVRS